MMLASAAVAGLGGLLSAMALALAPAPSAHRAGAGTPGERSWSPASTLAAGCAISGPPLLAFPSEAPNLPTGPGAIVWASEERGCGRGAAAPRGRFALAIAAIGPGERASISTRRSLTGAFSGELAAVGGSFGRVTVAAGSRGDRPPGRSLSVLQGRAGGPLGSRVLTESGARFSLARAYLGDVALAAVRGAAIVVHVERHYERGFEPARVIPIGRGRVTALLATMDFRSDVLVVWQQRGAVYADVLRASGSADAVQRIGPSRPDPQLQALISDDNRGMIAWSSADAARGGEAATRTFLDLSDAGVRFPAPRLLASFADPDRVAGSPGSLELVRLSSENVLLAWTDAEAGHYVVRGAPAVLAARGSSTLLSSAGAQAVLAGLAPGSAGEAIALWTGAPGGGGPSAPRTQLWAERTFVVPHDRLAHLPARMLATPGPIAPPSIAVDPANDRALAAWLTLTANPRIEYAVNDPAAGRVSRRASVGAPVTHAGVDWAGVALAASAVALAGALVLAATRRRRRQVRGG
jgi:hypothetical protein